MNYHRHRLAKLQGAITNQQRLNQLNSLKLSAADSENISDLFTMNSPSLKPYTVLLAPPEDSTLRKQTSVEEDLKKQMDKARPLWNVKKAVGSRVVNQRTEDGWNTSKLSAGDPYRLHRMIFETKSN